MAEKQMQIIGDAESNQQSGMSRSILESVIKVDVKDRDSRKKVASKEGDHMARVSGYKKSLVDDFNNI